MRMGRIFQAGLIALGCISSARAVTLQSVYDSTVGNTMNLAAGSTYTGSVTIARTMTINGNGAALAMNRAAVERINVNNGISLTINNLRVTSGFSVAKFGANASGTLNGVTASNLETAIEHDGGGALTIKNSVFRDLTSRGIITFGNTTTISLNNLEVRNAAYGVQFQGPGNLSAINCSFINVTNAIWTTGAALNSAGNPARLDGCTFNGGEFGVVLLAGTYARIEGCTMLGYRYPFQIKNGANVSLEDALILQNGISNPSVAVSVTDGAHLTAVSCAVTGYINSFDTSNNGFMDLSYCTMTHPAFSGVICKSNSTTNARFCNFIDNGQDSLFYGTDSAGSGDTSTGIIENNYSINAGKDNEFGTGIALLGSATYTVNNNVILNSLDVGIAVKYGANANIRGNQIIANKKAAIFLEGADSVNISNNVIAGHTANGQAGIIVDGSNLGVTAYGNLIAGNNFGVLFRGTASTRNFEYNLITRSVKQGFSVTQGRVSSTRSALVDNADYQAYVTSSEQSTFTDSIFASVLNRKGVYTERGSCASSAANKAVATGGWWNSTAGPQNRCSGSSPDLRMEYQNVETSGFRTAPQIEVTLIGNLNGQSVTTRFPASGSTTLPTISIPNGLTTNKFVGAFCPTAAFTEVPRPSGTSALPVVYLWGSPALNDGGGNVTLRFPQGAAFFGHTDNSVSFDKLYPTQPAAAQTVVSIPASELENGAWYFVNDNGTPSVVDLLLGKRSAIGVLPGTDLRVDAADL